MQEYGWIAKPVHGSVQRLKEEWILFDSMYMKSKNMQRDSITSNATTVGKSGGHTSDDKLQRMGCWKVETSYPRSDV